MSKTFSQFKNSVEESIGLVDTFFCCGKKVSIKEDFKVAVENEELDFEFSSLSEAKEFIKDYIKNTTYVDSIEDALIPEEKVASFITKHHNVSRVTNSLIESYVELAASNQFSVDPVILEMKQTEVTVLPNKIEWKLNDGSNMAVNLATQNKLNKILENKKEVVDFMRESKDNFLSIVREVI